MKNAYAKSQRQAWLVVLAASVVLAGCTIAASRQISIIENQLLNRIYTLPELLTEFLYVITQAGSAGAVIAVVATAFVLKRRQLAALLLANSVAAFLITSVIKELVARPRPAEAFADIVVRLDYSSGFGFPSGHTAVATAMALTLVPYTARKYQWLLWLWIVGVGFSRVYLGVHAPLDVVGGFCVGVIVVYASRLLISSRKRTKT